MKKIIKFVLIFSLTTFVGAIGVHAQQVIVNAKGERIVIFADGSWRYFELKDSTLLKQPLQRRETYNPNEDFSNEITSDPTLKDENNRNLATKFLRQIEGEYEQARKQLVNATNSKFNAEAKYEQARENKTIIDADILEGLKIDLDDATTVVKNMKKVHDDLEKLLGKAIDLPNLESNKRDKLYSKLSTKYSLITGKGADQIAAADPIRKTKKIKKYKSDKPSKEKIKVPKERSKSPRDKMSASKKPKKRPEKPIKSAKIDYPKNNSVSKLNSKYRSKPFDCNAVKEVVDDLTGQKRAIMPAVQIFSHTDAELRPYFRDQDLLKCMASLSNISGYKYLTVTFRISSPNARKNFGMLQSGSLLRIKLIDGNFLNFSNIQADRGKIDNYTGDTIFTGYYSIGKSAEKQLLKSEVDKVRVVWSVGYEDYEIYELDFFIDQINCLNNL